ncbi:MAG: glucose-1-phosphate thymidylyltransferase, partial [Muricauda sp.]|nr:glucose-1-phosphate thymidylyltransferase [Allomuricauda sp.]
MNYILSDGNHREDLFPFTFTRPVSEIRVGILTITEKWGKWLNASMSHQTEEYLSEKYPLMAGEENTVINSSYLPNEYLVEAIKNLKMGEALIGRDGYIAYVTENLEISFEESAYTAIPFDDEVLTIKNTWDIFSRNAEALQADFDLVTKGRTSQPIPD